jgi:hypothetical protein
MMVLIRYKKFIPKSFGKFSRHFFEKKNSAKISPPKVQRQPAVFGILPHPNGCWQEDLIDSCMNKSLKLELFASIKASVAPPGGAFLQDVREGEYC